MEDPNLKANAARRLMSLTACFAFAATALVAVSTAPASGAEGTSATTVTVLTDQLAAADPLPGGSDLFGQFGEPDTTEEPSLAVNPSNPANAVVAYMEGTHQNASGSQNIGFATTFDAGRTWTAAPLKVGMSAGGNWKFAADPSVAFGPDNHVYISFIGENTTPQAEQGLGFVRSTDGGRTWSDVLTIEGGVQFHDTDWLAVDNGTGPGHHPGRIYAAWTVFAPTPGVPVVTYSDDYGATWQPVSPVGPNPDGTTLGFDDKLVILANGDLGILYDTGAPGTDNLPPPPGYIEKYYFARAQAPSLPAQPLVFTSPVEVGEARNNPTDTQSRSAFDAAAIVVNPANGDIYAAWADGRFRTESVNPVNDIVLSRSSDGGTTWSGWPGEPMRVNQGRTDDYVNHFQPMLAVTPAGEIRVGYRQRRLAASPTNWSWNVDTYVQQATDSTNNTFSSAVRVNSVRTDIRFAANQGELYWLGDYSQMATAGQETLIARAEAYATSASESKSASWPPTVTHQRIWVSVVN